MPKVTITIDEETLRRARSRALGRGTSVNAILRNHLEDYARGRREYRQAVEEILELSRRAESCSGSDGRTWTRDELYDRNPGQRFE